MLRISYNDTFQEQNPEEEEEEVLRYPKIEQNAFACVCSNVKILVCVCVLHL